MMADDTAHVYWDIERSGDRPACARHRQPDAETSRRIRWW